MNARTFKVEVTVKAGKPADWITTTFAITFNDRESRGPDSTLSAIAANRIDAQFYASPSFKADGKNWTIKRVYDATAGPAEPGN